MPIQNEKCIAALVSSDEERLLLVRVGELLVQAEAGIPVHTEFLNPGEQYLCRAYLTHCAKAEGRDYLFWGGYPYAERCMLFLLPDYLYETCVLTGDDVQSTLCTTCKELDALGAVSVSGSGFCTLGHRDYLGALLALGVRRSVLGDIAVTDDAHACIIAKSAMLPYFETALTEVGRDKVKVRRCEEAVLEALPDTRKYADISDTVASLRLDAVVSALTGLSRDKAKQAVSAGNVTLNFRETVSPDAEVPDGAYLSVRGVGRFLFEGVDGTSKKGRLRIRARKFI